MKTKSKIRIIYTIDLQRFATPLTELFSQSDVLDYTRNREYPSFVGDELFPARKVRTLKIDMLLEGNRNPIIANYAAFDSEAEIGSREAQKVTAELAYIKRKMQIKEEDLIALKNPRDAAEQQYLTQQVYNDIDRLVMSIQARCEAMTMEMLATGKITDKEHNISIDYGVPKDHQTKLTGANAWNGSGATILDDLYNWTMSMDITPTRALTSQKVLHAIMTNPAVIKGIYGTETRVLTKADFDNFMQAQGLPVIRTYDLKYRVEDKKGKLTSERYFPEDRIVLMDDDLQGEKLYGPTPEENHLLNSNGTQISQVGNVFTKVYEQTQDPIGTWELASTTFLPSFGAVNEVYQAQVLA